MPTASDNSPDSYTRPSEKRPFQMGWLVIVVVLTLAGGYFYYSNQLEPAQISALSTPRPAATTAPDDAPPHPEERGTIPRLNDSAAVDQSTISATPDLPTRPVALPLPPYNQADRFLKKQLEMEQWQALNLTINLLPKIGSDHFLQRCIAFIDGLSRGELVAKLLPFPRPSTAFMASNQGNQLSMGEESFLRHQQFVENITAIDTTRAARFFHWTRPLLEIAYGELGYPPENLDGALLTAIDILLATPAIEAPLALKHESVLFSVCRPGPGSLAWRPKAAD